MTRQITFLITFLFLIFSSQSIYANEWSDHAKQDLASVHEILEINAAGMVDFDNVNFHNWIFQGYQKALERAEHVTDYAGYYFALKYYVNGFHDEHISLKFDPELRYEQLKFYWPGFLVNYDNDKYYVSKYFYNSSDRTLPPIGTELLSCNNKSPKTLMLERIFPYDGNPTLNADWVANTPLLLVDRDNRLVPPLTSCCFAGAVKETCLKLNMQVLGKDFDARRAAYPYSPQFNDYTFYNGQGVWLSIPSFNAKSEKSAQALQSLVDKAGEWKDKKIIVFDVRGNSGGNSAWGDKVLSKIFGQRYAKQLQNNYKLKAFTEWRVSRGNLHYLKKTMLPHLKNTVGTSSEVYRQINKLVKRMSTARKYKKGVVSVERSKRRARKKKLGNNPLGAKVILVTDGRCASSCLNFVGELLGIPDILFVGKPTHADTSYTEQRFATVASKRLQIGFPMKITQHRTRKNNEPYTPQFIFPGDINDTVSLQKWLHSLLIKQGYFKESQADQQQYSAR